MIDTTQVRNGESCCVITQLLVGLSRHGPAHGLHVVFISSLLSCTSHIFYPLTAESSMFYVIFALEPSFLNMFIAVLYVKISQKWSP